MHLINLKYYSTRLVLLQIYPPYKNLVPRFLRWRKEVREILAKIFFSFPRSFFSGVVGPLNFQELDSFVSSSPFCFLKNANRMFAISQVFLEVNILNIDSTDRILETTTELGDMEHIVNICKVGWQLQLIG